MLCVTGVASAMNVTSRGPCFYFSADISVEPIGPVLVTAAHGAKRLWLLFNVRHGESLPTLGSHFGSRAAVISER